MTLKTNKPLALIVEDDKSTLKMMYYYLRDDYDYRFAESVIAAREILNTEPVDIILVDLSLIGEEDGLDLVRELRQQKKWESLPIIATTAYAFLSDQEQCLKAGCNDYLAKPIKREKLLKKMQALL
jgi:CheY-like chemotaxis protein